LIEIYFKTKCGFVPRAPFDIKKKKKTETKRKNATVAMSSFFHA
jgi:hypothetical protein